MPSEVTITLSINKDSLASAGYLDATGALSMDLVADLFDMFVEADFEGLESINGITFEKTQLALKEAAGI